ncbi:MAG: hypothetical protein ABH824_04320 [Nanoarchaeota archaeon]
MVNGLEKKMDQAMDSGIQEVVRKQEVTDTELALIINLLFFDSNPLDTKSFAWKEGWQGRKQVLNKKKSYFVEFTAGPMNLSNYMKFLKNRGLVEIRWYRYKDKRGRKHKERQFRLIPTLTTHDRLVPILGRAVLKQVTNKQKITIPEPNKTDFYKLLNKNEALRNHIEQKSIIHSKKMFKELTSAKSEIDLRLNILKKQLNKWEGVSKKKSGKNT